MLLRSRLKKELVNLLTWKNKKFWIILIVFGIGLLITTKYKNQLPEDHGSLGNSVVQTRLDKIDNYDNVDSYRYWLYAGTSERLHLLKDVDFSFWNEIPFRIDQYLQGICFAEEYLLVSAYCESEDMLGELLIFDAKTGEYLLTLGMDEESHLGGVTYDGTYIWVCNSKKQTLERLSYQVICDLLKEHTGKMVNVTNLVDVYSVENIPSCITFYDGSLWVATHQKWGSSRMVRYYYDVENDSLSSQSWYRIPSRVQGVAFREDGAVMFSSSYGRRRSSCLVQYTSLSALSDKLYHWERMIEMPPCSEGIAYHEGKIYVVFESAGEKYFAGTDGYGTSLSPLNRILIIWDQA